jgi:hypothetical protein
MLKTVHRYEQTAARLVVEGYPDLSDGQEGDHIGILSGWRLQLVGAPELEGTRDHLEAMMAAVMPYARHQLSGIGGRFGADQGFVGIEAVEGKHQLQLRSSREGVKPLQLLLDDADLADLVRCLDRLRLDDKVKLQWTYPEDRPLARRDLLERIPLQRRLAPAALGGLVLSLSTALALLLPLPPRPGTTTSVDVAEPGSRIVNETK